MSFQGLKWLNTYKNMYYAWMGEKKKNPHWGPAKSYFTAGLKYTNNVRPFPWATHPTKSPRSCSLVQHRSFLPTAPPAITLPSAATNLGTRNLFPFHVALPYLSYPSENLSVRCIKSEIRIRKMLPSSHRVNRHIISIKKLVRRGEKHRLGISHTGRESNWLTFTW